MSMRLLSTTIQHGCWMKSMCIRAPLEKTLEFDDSQVAETTPVQTPSQHSFKLALEVAEERYAALQVKNEELHAAIKVLLGTIVAKIASKNHAINSLSAAVKATLAASLSQQMRKNSAAAKTAAQCAEIAGMATALTTNIQGTSIGPVPKKSHRCHEDGARARSRSRTARPRTTIHLATMRANRLTPHTEAKTCQVSSCLSKRSLLVVFRSKSRTREFKHDESIEERCCGIPRELTIL